MTREEFANLYPEEDHGELIQSYGLGGGVTVNIFERAVMPDEERSALYSEISAIMSTARENGEIIDPSTAFPVPTTEEIRNRWKDVFEVVDTALPALECKDETP